MSDDSATSAMRSIRRRMGLLVALIPIAAGTLWLASRPPWNNNAHITEDGTYVVTATNMGWNPPQWEVRRLDLRTGRTICLPRLVENAHFGFAVNHWWLYYTERDGELASLSRFRFDDFSEEQLPEPQRWKIAPRLLDDQRLVGFDRDGALRLVNLQTGAEQTFPLPPSNARRFVYQLTEADRAVMTERVASGGTTGFRLLSLSEPIKQITEWNSNEILYDVEHGEVFHTLNLDKHSLEALSLEDGGLVREYSLASLFEQLPSAKPGVFLPQRNMFGLWDPIQNRCFLYDYERHEILDCLPRDVEGVEIAQDESFLVLGRGSNGFSIFDLDTLSTVWQYQHKQARVASRLSADQQRLITVFRDGSVMAFDVETGDVLRTYRRRAAVLPVFGCVLVGFITWCLVWVRAGMQLRSSPLMDAIFLNGLIAATLIVRVNLSGSMQDASRLAYQTAQSLFASWLALLTFWVVFGKARWSVRILVPLLGMAGIFMFVLVNFRGDHFGVWQLVIGAFVVAIVCTSWFALLRRWNYSLSHSGHAATLPAKGRRSIPLRDLFFITAAVAALLAVVRFISPHQFEAREAAEMALMVMSVSLTGVAATWFGLSQRHWILRLLLLSLVVLVAGAVLPATFAAYRSWHHWRFAAKYQALIAIFTLGTALIFRSRGWQLRRAARA